MVAILEIIKIPLDFKIVGWYNLFKGGLEMKYRIFNIGTRIDYEVYGRILTKRKNGEDHAIRCTKLILAKDLNEAFKKYKISTKDSDVFLPHLTLHKGNMINCSMMKETSREIIELKTDWVRFDDIKKELQHEDFMEYLRQELNISNLNNILK